MSRFRPTIEMKPSGAQLVQMLAGIPPRATDLRPAFQRIVADFITLQEQKIGSRRGWKPLSLEYAARKASQFPGRPILVRTGRMIAALTGRSGEFRAEIGEQRLLVRVSGGSIRRGYPLWGVHQRGRAGGNPMPRRAVVASRALMRKRWREILHEHLTKAAAAART